MLANSGQVFALNPAVVAWLPSILLAIVTAISLRRIN
jgi:lipopolysaccharide export LptBFGC system permease protein LptF